MGVTYSQFFPPAPTLTEANLPRQDGKVFIVTGGASGVGFELSRILYHAGGRVYIAGRSEANANAAIQAIRALPTKSSPGSLVFLPVSLEDLASIKPAAERFMAAESRLDVLFNNAGVSQPPRGSVSVQGHELQMAVNCMAPYLLTQLLAPVLVKTAAVAPASSVRVVWTGSIVVDLMAPNGGYKPEDLTRMPGMLDDFYTLSKVWNWFLADDAARELGPKGVMSVVQNPGNLKTALLRNMSVVPILTRPLLYKAVMGAYTELWSGLATELTVDEHNGCYILPWGRIHPAPRQDMLDSMRTKDDGGTGLAQLFVDHCERQTAAFR